MRIYAVHRTGINSRVHSRHSIEGHWHWRLWLITQRMFRFQYSYCILEKILKRFGKNIKLLASDTKKVILL